MGLFFHAKIDPNPLIRTGSWYSSTKVQRSVKIALFQQTFILHCTWEQYVPMQVKYGVEECWHFYAIFHLKWQKGTEEVGMPTENL